MSFEDDWRKADDMTSDYIRVAEVDKKWSTQKLFAVILMLLLGLLLVLGYALALKIME